jgi:endonuclease YncB( thermonuclease family)
LKRLVILVVVLSVLAGCGSSDTGKKEASDPPQTTAAKTTAKTTSEKTSTRAKTTSDQGIDPSRYDATTTVTRVVDGDTVDISPAVEGKTRVRLIGVDTPETKDPRLREAALRRGSLGLY